MDIIQLAIVTVLMFVLFFGIGFILNMLLKSTWLPIYLFFVLLAALVIYWAVGPQTLMHNLQNYGVADYLPAIAGLIGSMASGFAIRTLRRQGFRMF